MTDTTKDRTEGHYWVRFGTSPNWDVMYWRDGYFWDHGDCGYTPDNFEIGPRAHSPVEALTAAKPVTDHTELLRKIRTKFGQWAAIRGGHGVYAELIDEIEAALSQEHVAGESAGEWIGGQCATEGCGNKAAVRFERHGIGSVYCRDCYLKVQAVVPPTAPTPELQESAQLEVVARYSPDSRMDGFHGMVADTYGNWVKYADHAATLDAANKAIADRDDRIAGLEATGDVQECDLKTLTDIHSKTFRRAEAAEARIAELEKALEPFAAIADEFYALSKPDEWGVWGYNGVVLTYGQFREARAALHSNQKGAGDEA